MRSYASLNSLPVSSVNILSDRAWRAIMSVSTWSSSPSEDAKATSGAKLSATQRNKLFGPLAFDFCPENIYVFHI